jgi:hypothetical protein
MPLFLYLRLKYEEHRTNTAFTAITKLFHKTLIILYRKSFRDAVAQAGTVPALSAIVDFIRKGYITGEEAAEVVAVLPVTVRTPTPEYIDLLFVSI